MDRRNQDPDAIIGFEADGVHETVPGRVDACDSEPFGLEASGPREKILDFGVRQ